MELMRCGVWVGEDRFEVQEHPKPVPGAGEVRVRVEACGVCLTDVHSIDDAWIFFTDPDGNLHQHLLADVFPAWAAPPPDRIAGRFISVTQAGDIASVRLGFDDVSDASDSSHRHGTSWVDFHTLLRINGVWKITDKTATHGTRAGWARTHINAGGTAPLPA